MKTKDIINIGVPYKDTDEILRYLEKNGFKIIECIHENSSLNTKIYHARKKNGIISRDVCLKVLFSDISMRKQYDEKFVLIKENFGTHKNLIQVLDVFRFDFSDITVFVLEYEWLSSCQKLFDEIRSNKRLLEKNTAKMIRDISDGIEKLHRSGFAHNDIKLSNILYKTDHTAECGKVFILSDLDTVTSNENCEQISESQGYAAPEIASLNKTQLNRDNIAKIDRKKCDIYSLGMVIYKIFNNNLFPYQHSFDDDGFIEKLNNPDRGYFPPNENIPSEILSIINKACQFRPEDRFGEIQGLASAFSHVASNASDEEETFITNIKPYTKEDEASTKNYHVSDFSGSHSDTEESEIQNKKSKKKHSSVSFPFFVFLAVIAAVAVYSTVIFFINSPVNPKIEITTESSSVEKTIDEIIGEIDSVAEKDGTEEALKLVNNLLSTYPYSDELLSKRREFTDIINEQKKNAIIKDADELAEKNRFIEAYEEVKKLDDEIGGDKELTEKMKQYEENYVSAVIDDTVQFADNRDYDSVLSAVSEALEYFPNNNTLSEYKELIIEEKAEYEYSILKSDVLSRAEEFFKSKDYEQAVNVLKSESSLLDDNDIIEKINEYQLYIPVSLCSMVFTDVNNAISNTVIDDPRGNSYSGALSLCGVQEWDLFTTTKSEIEYYIGDNYNRLTCEIVPEANFSKESGVYAIIEIYGDDELIYTSDRINYKTEYIRISEDISNYSYLKFKLLTPKNKRILDPQTIDCGIVNGVLSK